ncbi:Protein CELLULOSE SYNTHASE INTERACTIVE 3 [Linum perenne]
MATVSNFIEKLHAKVSSHHEKELITARVLGIAKAQKEARTVIGSHAQAMPLFVSILRDGTHGAKLNVAATLCVMSKDDDLRVKVLLGGCIPPLLSLLKSESHEARKAAAEAIYEVSSDWRSDDHIGMKIFLTESVIPTLWDQLDAKNKQDKVVQGFVTGALRNLCVFKDSYWKTILEAGGVKTIIKLLSSGNSVAQSNAASLLASLMLTFNDIIVEVIDSGTIKSLLELLEQNNDISVRASAAEALEALTCKSEDARKHILDANGVYLLIGAAVVPSKDCPQEAYCRALRTHATRALANIYGGMPALILHLAQLSQSPRLSAPVADILGSLASALMIYEHDSAMDEEPFDATKIEDILIKLLKPRDTKLFQERVVEAMASLYGNEHLKKWVDDADAKKLLTTLVTMATGDGHESLILSLLKLCRNKISVWESIGKREGIQMLISLLGLSSVQHQECAVGLLLILTDQVDDSKWAITAAGGIPPLVQLLEMGSQKARDDATLILWNLCCHSEDIHACVESAGAVSAFIWFLKSGGPRGQETSVKALLKLIRTADPAAINQLLPLLQDESINSKSHIIRVLGHILTLTSEKDLTHTESAANKAITSLVQVLNSPNRETQEYAAYILADLLTTRQDICHSLSSNEIVDPCKKILNGNNNESVVKQLAQALSALSRPKKMKSSKKMTQVVDKDVKPLINLAKTSPIDSAESAVAALANILSDPHIAAEALVEDVVSALIRVLGEGSLQGKKSASRALNQLLKHFPVSEVLSGSAQCRFVILSILESLSSMEKKGIDVTDCLEVVSLLARTKQGADLEYQPWAALVEVPSRLEPIIYCLAKGSPTVQDKAIELLCRLCGEQPVMLGDLLIARSSSIGVLAHRIANSPSSEVRVGGTALLICVAKEHKQKSLEEIDGSGYVKPLIYNLVNMVKHNSRFSSLEIEVQSPSGFYDRSIRERREEFDMVNPSTVLGSTAALWLLAIITSFCAKNKLIVMEGGGLEVLANKLLYYTSHPQSQAETGDREGIWISGLVLAVLFQDAKVVLSPTSMRIVPSLAYLLKSDKMIDRFFASQALASLVCNESKGICVAIANSGAVTGLIPLIGYIESDMPNLSILSEEFSLEKNPAQLALQHLFKVEDVQAGASSHDAIPLLVDLLRPIPNRPHALSTAIDLLYRIAEGSDTNKLLMAEVGALEALTQYLSSSPRDSNEASISELLRVLFKNTDLIRHDVALRCLGHLIAVLRLSSRDARFSAARALHELFNAEKIRNCDLASQAVQPLIDMVNVAESESEQQSALNTLIKLTSGSNSSKAASFFDVDGNALETVYKILSTSSSLELKGSAAQVCFVLFSNKKFRETPIAPDCIDPLVSLMRSPSVSGAESAVWAFERLLDDEQLVEHVSTDDAILDLLVGLVSGTNYRLIEGSVSVLIKLGKDRAHRKQDMLRAGILDKCLELLPHASMSLCSAIAELFRILTNSGAIARNLDAVKIVDPLFDLLLQPDFNLCGQHSALHAIVNILEKPECLTTLRLTPSQTIEPLISFLESPTQELQHVGTELLSHLLAQEHFQQDIMTKDAVVPLVRLAGIGILALQEIAVSALDKIASNWPKEVVDAGGIFQLSKIIVQDDPEPSLELWEAAALILSNLLRFNNEYYFKIPLLVLVRMLQSTVESTIQVVLNALIVRERTDISSAEQMTEAGVVDGLMDLLRSHHCEEMSGRLLEALFNKVRVREMKITKYAIAPLAQYLLDPQTTSETCKLLAALALGDLSQQEGHARSSDSVSACRALVSLLEDQPSEEMTMVAVCALQNFVMHSRTNRRAVAEAGGILVIQELLISPSANVAAQASMLIKLLFSNQTLQEYVSTEILRSLTAALEREFLSAGTLNIHILKAINVLFTNFAKLHVSEAATLCITHLVTALKSDNETACKCALDTLCVLKESWIAMPVDIAKSQAMIAAEAVSVLQNLSKACPPGTPDRADALLRCLPGCLTVTIKRGNNLKQANAFCVLTIGNSPQRQTKVISNTNSPEWNESFTWAFDIAPRGQQLNIACKSKSTFGKTTTGRVAVQFEKVVTDGVYSGKVSLTNEGAKKDTSRTLEIDIVWDRISDLNTSHN